MWQEREESGFVASCNVLTSVTAQRHLELDEAVKLGLLAELRLYALSFDRDRILDDLGKLTGLIEAVVADDERLLEIPVVVELEAAERTDELS